MSLHFITSSHRMDDHTQEISPCFVHHVFFFLYILAFVVSLVPFLLIGEKECLVGECTSCEALRANVEQLKLDGKHWKLFLFFLNPYKNHTKKREKGLRLVQNTYINQATFHYLFINHIHISKYWTFSFSPPLLQTRKTSQKLNNTVSAPSAHQDRHSFWMAHLEIFFLFL